MEVRESSAAYSFPSCELTQTDAGLVPQDWRVMPFVDGVALCMDFRGRTPRKLGMSWGDGDILALSANNVQMGRIDESKEAYRGSNALYQKWMTKGDCAPGDVLLTTEAPLGNVAQVPDTAKYILSQRVLLIRPQTWISKDFFAHYLRSTAFQGQLDSNSSGSTAKGIQRARLEQLPIALPLLAEQQAIAEALSDADALIESLSLLLAKKRQIKQGAMQELLTGKKRLPGFNADWVARRLDQLADIRSGGTPSTAQEKFWNGDVLWCTPTDITALEGHKYLRDTARKLTPLGLRASAAEPIPVYSIVMTSRATIGECAINLRPVTTNQGFKSFVPFDGVDAEFLYYLLQTQRTGFISLCGGSTFLEIGKSQLSAYEVFVPTLKDEQAAVAVVLSEMDQEIDLLRAKLNKAKEIKQGMMQALLTGRVRLVQPASNVIPLPTKPAANRPAGQPAHNWQINEAVVIGVLAHRFGSEKFPLPRKRRVKLTYLLHRHAEGRAEGYLKKAAGPYDPNTKYKGPEQIALKNGYVRALRNEKYEGFVAGGKIEQAQRYFEQWYGAATLEWLERFHYRKTDDLELLATVDMAMVDLAADGEPADVTRVKRVIAAHPEWLPKLSRELFSDERIAAAIAECWTLFGG